MTGLDADVVVVGSGPAGASAAWAMAGSGLRILILEAGTGRWNLPARDRPPLATMRRQPGHAAQILGRDLCALTPLADLSPKIRIAGAVTALERFAAANRLEPNGFAVVGALVVGGLGNFWGGAVSCFDARDMAGWPIAPALLAESYRAVAARIGVSGSLDDDLAAFHGRDIPVQPALPLAPPAERLLLRYAGSARARALTMGLARNAVLSQPLGDREACRLDNACFWGCGARAIYNAADDVAALEKHPGFELRCGVIVEEITREHGFPAVCWRDATGAQRGTLRARKVVLAAGTLATTRLALSAFAPTERRTPVLNTPCAAIAVLVHGFLGEPLPERGVNLAQLSVRLPLGDDYALLQLYAASGISAPDIAAHLPFTMRGSASLLRRLMPGLMLGLIYLPSEFSDSVASLDEGRLRIEGGMQRRTPTCFRVIARQIRWQFLRLGALVLPYLRIYPPGAEAHVGGTLPMGRRTSSEGMLRECPDVHLVDGSVLNRLPAKHHTFTVMANAHRIGRVLARDLQATV